MNQCWNVVNWSIRNKLHWNFNRNSNILIQENALQNVVCQMASILSRPQCVNTSPLVPHICSVNWVNFATDNGLSSVWCQAIIWINVYTLSTEPLGTNVREILMKIQQFSFKKMSSAKWPPSVLVPMCWTKGLDKMADIVQTIFSDAFSSLIMFVFWLKFHCKVCSQWSKWQKIR